MTAGTRVMRSSRSLLLAACLCSGCATAHLPRSYETAVPATPVDTIAAAGVRGDAYLLKLTEVHRKSYGYDSNPALRPVFSRATALGQSSADRGGRAARRGTAYGAVAGLLLGLGTGALSGGGSEPGTIDINDNHFVFILWTGAATAGGALVGMGIGGGSSLYRSLSGGRTMTRAEIDSLNALVRDYNAAIGR